MTALSNNPPRPGWLVWSDAEQRAASMPGSVSVRYDTRIEATAAARGWAAGQPGRVFRPARSDGYQIVEWGEAVPVVEAAPVPVARSSRAEVRNPVLALPASKQLRLLPADSRAAMAAVLSDLAADAGRRAQASWRTHKAPMAVYWKAVAVYAKHLSRALRGVS